VFEWVGGVGWEGEGGGRSASHGCERDVHKLAEFLYTYPYPTNWGESYFVVLVWAYRKVCS